MEACVGQKSDAFHDLSACIPVGILTCKFDAYFSIMEANDGLLQLLGYTVQEFEEISHDYLKDIVHPEDFLTVSERILKHYLNNEFISLLFRIQCKDGRYKQVQCCGRFHSGKDGLEQWTGVMIERLSAAVEEECRPGRTDTLSPFWGKHIEGLDGSGVMLCEWEMKTDTLSYSYNWSDKSGIRPAYNQNCLQVDMRGRIHPDDRAAYSGLLQRLREGSVYGTTEFRIINIKKEYVWCQMHAVLLYDRDEKPVKAVCVIFDIDERKRAIEDLKIRAECDALTGLYNRNETERQIKDYLDRRKQALCALFMIDTDNFKQINDTKGHMLGDVVLTEMASGMKKIMRRDDVVGRIGGDEFAVFMKDISSKEAAVCKAEELAGMFRRLFENEKRSIKITCSIGVALYPDDGQDFQTLYRHADRALYEAKKQGKDGYMLYDKERANLSGDTGYSTLGATIDSPAVSMGVSWELLVSAFKLLYKAEDLDQAVNQCLKLVGTWFDVSRAYIFETGESGDYYRNTYEWCNEGILPEIQNLQHLDLQTAGDYRELFGPDSIYYCRNTHALPPIQRKLFEDQGIHSFLQYALWEKEKFAGFIGFDECTGMRLWTQEEVSALSQISELLDTFLNEKKVQRRLRMMQQMMRYILENEDDYICVIKKDTYNVLFANSRMKQMVSGLDSNSRCYESFFYRDRPCRSCPMHGGQSDFSRKDMCTLVNDTVIQWEGQDAYLIAFRHFDSERSGNEENTADDIISNAYAEKNMAGCIQWLTASDYRGDPIEYVLGIIREYYQSDRAYIIEADELNGTGSNIYEVCAEDVVPQIEKLQNVPIEAISFWLKQFIVRDYIRIDDIEELGPDRQVEYEVLKAQGIRSLMALPLYIKGEIKGFLGLDDPKANKDSFRYLEKLTYFLENEITKNAMRRRLEQMSYEDTLTGLENRNSYMVYCDDFSKRSPVPAGVVFMDINGLKKLNSVRGHMYGDMVITHVADLMKQYFPEDKKFRLSGDEFLIVTEAVPYDEFQKRFNLMEERLSANGASIVSIGTTWSDVGVELTELVDKAEKLMHIRKQDYYRGYKELAAEKIPLLKEVADSILNRKYLIYLQPKLNISTGEVDCAEVLVRYREKDGSISSPVKFIPLLESEGIISNLDFFVLDEVCRLLTTWKNTKFANMKLALNFSRITLFDKKFLENFWKIFSRYDLKPEQFEIEITETQETLNKKQMAFLLEELTRHGFQIALDDFGVEYSSYEFLMMASFHVLKIDKGIIQRYEEAARGKVLVKHIVDMGHSIGAKCCAEGVETKAQFDFMREIGCDYAQGYLIDRPMPVDQFEMKYMQERGI